MHDAHIGSDKPYRRDSVSSVQTKSEHPKGSKTPKATAIEVDSSPLEKNEVASSPLENKSMSNSEHVEKISNL